MLNMGALGAPGDDCRGGRAGRVHAVGCGAAAGARQCGERVAGARHEGQGPPAGPAHCRQEGRPQIDCPSAAERAAQCGPAD